MRDDMNKSRYEDWLDASFGIQYVEMLMLHEVQGLGIIDVELLQELSQLRVGSQVKEDLSKMARYHTLCKLWTIGVYETIQVIRKMIKNKPFFKQDTLNDLEKTFTLFTKIRVPLAKFQRSAGKNQELYSGVADSFIDPLNGFAWKVYSSRKKEIHKDLFYRKDLADAFLELLKKITRDVRTEYHSLTQKR